MNGFAAISTNAVAYPENLSDKYCVPSAVFNPDNETTFFHLLKLLYYVEEQCLNF